MNPRNVLSVVVITLLAAAPVPGVAQEIAIDTGLIDACLADATADARETCIGVAARACTETPDGYTTAGMSACFGQEHDWWDARLNAVYTELLDLSQTFDAEMDALESHAPRLAPALREMQRAWIPYRDAACGYERAQWGGGTGGGPATWACLMQMTGEQVLRLQARLDESRQQ